MEYNLKIYASIIEPVAQNQIYNLLYQAPFKDAKVRIMPDVHIGNNCVVGFTSTLSDKVIPNVIGVDIGCGMLTVELGKVTIDFKSLDDFIYNNIPHGSEIYTLIREEELVKKLRCYKKLKDIPRALRSCGSLGGGNHFIEIDKDEDNNYYLIIHSGSRNLGLQVAEYYQDLAINICKNAAEEERNEVIKKVKEAGLIDKLDEEIAKVNKKYAHLTKIPSQFCYLTGNEYDDYLFDLGVCQEFASKSRMIMAEMILKFLNITNYKTFETVHNFIEFNEKGTFIRKGAIPAYKGQKVLIPMNMRDGCIIGIGKGNEDWNYSAPHGAGRLLSRGEVKSIVDVNEFKEAMKGIYTTTANERTIDESPFAYKPMEAIVELIKPTVDIVKIIKPVYNFKAAK